MQILGIRRMSALAFDGQEVQFLHLMYSENCSTVVVIYYYWRMVGRDEDTKICVSYQYWGGIKIVDGREGG